jgi:S-adenosylmethionine decarboxylase
MLDEVHCKVLSIIDSEHIDAYLLSESSMFVFPHKLILKTCGTTTLLNGVNSILRIAAVEAGFPFHNVKALDDERVAATPYRLFYSRKNFLHPEKQPKPHSSWAEEVKFLDNTFTGGRAYMVGRVNADHWYLYMISPETILTPPSTPEYGKSSVRSIRASRVPVGMTSAFDVAMESNDETLEILMTDLDPDNAKQFYMDRAEAEFAAQDHETRQTALDSLGDLSASLATIKTSSTADSLPDETFDITSIGSNSDNRGSQTPMSEDLDRASFTTQGHALGTLVSKCCGLSDVYPVSTYPDARIDAYMFDPCGFSANGVIPSPQADGGDPKATATHYFTVHVTPEPHCSYASFETNVPGGRDGRDTSEIIEDVVGIFKPGRFSLTLFEAKGPAADIYGSAQIKRVKKIQGYRCIDRVVHDFDDYDLIFRFFEREGWDGGHGMRVGEV